MLSLSVCSSKSSEAVGNCIITFYFNHNSYQISMPEFPYGVPFESSEPIPCGSPRHKTYSWARLVGVMPHQSITLTEKEVTENQSANSITASESLPGDVENNRDAEKNGKSSGLLRIMTCGAGLFSDGYLNGVRSFLARYVLYCGG